MMMSLLGESRNYGLILAAMMKALTGDGPPTCIVRDDYVPILREYWATFKRTIPSGCSFQGGQEMANESDQRHFYDWFTAHKPAEVSP